MTATLPIPYKYPYTLAEFWDELTRGTLWAAYAKANPKEAALLDHHARRKIAQLGGEIIPAGMTRTHTGNALLMALLTLH